MSFTCVQGGRGGGDEGARGARMERVVEEVKGALKPHYARGVISKDEYKDIMRRAVPKVRCLFPQILPLFQYWSTAALHWQLAELLAIVIYLKVLFT